MIWSVRSTDNDIDNYTKVYHTRDMGDGPP